MYALTFLLYILKMKKLDLKFLGTGSYLKTKKEAVKVVLADPQVQLYSNSNLTLYIFALVHIKN